MNKKIDEEYKDIKDVYILQCICSELKDRVEKYRHLFKTTKIEEKDKEIEKLKKENEELKHKLKLINSYVYGCNIDSLGSDKE